MKISNFYFLFLILILSGCNKKKVCSLLPDGNYGTYFDYDNDYTGTEKEPFIGQVSLSKIHSDTYMGDASSGFTKIKIQDCSIGGTIQGHTCVGEIRKEKDKYIIEGVFTYYYNTNGLVSPNFVEVPGEFELISQ